ncbi:hypothetical protein RGF97_14170 [Streptomyces roseicoloratus]|uniref:NfeD-like C-terminal domain-containing protein n=1 Tax=Streptomyces roseicoloratus TaxID=2508722 RepID=A0ABY9RU97_9ACTN|nr:hypothetical protein [Streptomyces roseicoloratus]WMX45774.1 hypothetical protein RGF97_14170 [Streptomyces roseicoloratus]
MSDTATSGAGDAGGTGGRNAGDAHGVQASARGWLTLQLAALGFVGLCGALKAGGSGSTAPRGVEAVAGVLVLVALFVAILAVYLVGRTAWPHSATPDDPVRAARRLRTGLVLTFITVLLTALAATTAWWPAPETPPAAGQGGAVEVTTSTGRWCGELTRGSGALALEVRGRTVEILVTDVLAVTPVADCANS